MGVVDLTEREKRKNPTPCDGCEMGWGSIGQHTDLKTGHLIQESHDCQETCQRFKDFWDKPLVKKHKDPWVPFFGKHIREAIKTIKGK